MDWRRFFKPKTPQTPQTPQKPNAIPMLDQVMSATKGATDAFSGVSKQVNNSFRMLGTSSIPGIVGYGIGLRHGIGLGLSVRSGVNQLQSRIVEPMTKMIGLIPGVPFGRGALPMPESSKSGQSKVPTDQISAESMIKQATKTAEQFSQGSMTQEATKAMDQISQASMMMQQATKSVDQISQGSMTQLATKSSSQISQGLVGSQPTKTDSAFDNKALKGDAVVSASDSQTEKAISNFSQNPSLKIEGGGLDQAAGLMQPENKLLQTVMKQRQIIDELVEENEKLYQILQVKDMKIPSTKPQASSSDSNIQTFPSSEVQDKRTGVSMPPANAVGISTSSKGENDGALSISKGENDGPLPNSKGENDTKK
ncbi:uncharacterized protein LOC109801394 isoform X2 [Cajanus cajan]|uniref:uncharacterized protein LOC109801394 isoform X2 n=1 Tax=Cajanus cajan TaxID=3821 RepID=UPI0010FB119B|nr:uncharacterized protein LOC109801394 isoform X2 [Cajanus cajan]